MPPRSRTFSDMSALASNKHMSLHALPFTHDVHTSFGGPDLKAKETAQQSFLFGDTGLLDLNLDADDEDPVVNDNDGQGGEDSKPPEVSDVERKGSLVLGGASLDHDQIESADLSGFIFTVAGTTSSNKQNDIERVDSAQARESQSSFEFHHEPLPSLSSWPMAGSPSYDNGPLSGGSGAHKVSDVGHRTVRLEGWPSGDDGTGGGAEQKTEVNGAPKAMGLKRSESMAAIRLRDLFAPDGGSADEVAETSSAKDRGWSMAQGRSGSAPPVGRGIGAPPSPFEQIGELPRSPRSGKPKASFDVPETIVSGEVFQP
jgi:hypothetical protein